MIAMRDLQQSQNVNFPTETSGRSSILASLKVFPKGKTTRGLLEHLDIDNNSLRSRQILKELTVLVGEGVLELSKGRVWRLAKAPQRRPVEVTVHFTAAPEFQATQPDVDFLDAVTGRIRRRSVDIEMDGDDVQRAVTPNQLLRYYRAALRSDPRGSTEGFPDRHGTQWQLVQTSEIWWPGDTTTTEIRIPLERLPVELRESLARREGNENGVALGWPLLLQDGPSGPTATPVGLLAAIWSRDSQDLCLTLDNDQVVLNPVWVKKAGRQRGWTAQTLADSLTGETGEVGLETFRQRLREVAARSSRDKLDGIDLRGSLSLSDEGLFDALAMFLPTDQSFTKGAVDDLDRIAEWDGAAIGNTALHGLLLAQAGQSELARPPVLHPGPLNGDQIEAAANSQSAGLSVVTGPPGTGKSQAIVAMVATAVANGDSVLIASKNHQALDAVEERLVDLLGSQNALVRTLDPNTDRDTDFGAVIEALIAIPGSATAAGGTLEPALDLANNRRDLMTRADERKILNFRIAEHLERLSRVGKSGDGHVQAAQSAIRKPSLVARLINWLLNVWRRKAPQTPSGIVPAAATAKELRDAVTRDRDLLSLIPSDDSADPAELTDKVAEATSKVFASTYARKTLLAEEDRQILVSASSDARLHGWNSQDQIALAQVVLKARPVWLASVLGTPKRIPLAAGLFDLVIFDEASQCDIASALPLLARAKRAAIVGDNNQLSFIPGLGAAQDRNLMAAQGLPDRGMGRFAQGLNSLFDLAVGTANVPRVLLRQQFRSASDITDYISENFYGGRLQAAVLESGLNPPQGQKPGLYWSDVPGAYRQTTGGTSNPPEAKAVGDQLRKLIKDGYTGSIGIIAPFNAQVTLIEEMIADIDAEVRTRVQLKVSTVDRFQGQERDLILFSPTLCASSPQTAKTFIIREWRRINVAISRARAVAHVFGDLSFARVGGIRTLSKLAHRATSPREAQGEGVFDSEWERIVFHALKQRGLSPTPQYPIAGRRLDFALKGAEGQMLDLEVDGRRWHMDADGLRKVGDVWRDHQLKSLGWKVRRFWVDELDKDMERCLDIIERDLA